MPSRSPDPIIPITIEPNRGRVVVTLGGRVIAATSDALTLREANYPPVHYIPRKDVDMEALILLRRPRPTAHTRERPPTSAFPAGGERSV